MGKQHFEIIDGVYAGPDVYEGGLDLRPYKDTLISLGPLKEVVGYLNLMGCSSLTSLGDLKGVWGLYLEGCISLTSLGDLKEVHYCLDLEGCSNIISLGGLTKVGEELNLRGCSSLTSLGALKEVGCSLTLNLRGSPTPLQEVLEKACYYSSLLAHEALNALHFEEVQETYLYKNILLQTLQRGQNE